MSSGWLGMGVKTQHITAHPPPPFRNSDQYQSKGHATVSNPTLSASYRPAPSLHLPVRLHPVVLTSGPHCPPLLCRPLPAPRPPPPAAGRCWSTTPGCTASGPRWAPSRSSTSFTTSPQTPWGPSSWCRSCSTWWGPCVGVRRGKQGLCSGAQGRYRDAGHVGLQVICWDYLCSLREFMANAPGSYAHAATSARGCKCAGDDHWPAAGWVVQAIFRIPYGCATCCSTPHDPSRLPRRPAGAAGAPWGEWEQGCAGSMTGHGRAVQASAAAGNVCGARVKREEPGCAWRRTAGAGAAVLQASPAGGWRAGSGSHN